MDDVFKKSPFNRLMVYSKAILKVNFEDEELQRVYEKTCKNFINIFNCALLDIVKILKLEGMTRPHLISPLIVNVCKIKYNPENIHIGMPASDLSRSSLYPSDLYKNFDVEHINGFFCSRDKTNLIVVNENPMAIKDARLTPLEREDVFMKHFMYIVAHEYAHFLQMAGYRLYSTPCFLVYNGKRTSKNKISKVTETEYKNLPWERDADYFAEYILTKIARG